MIRYSILIPERDAGREIACQLPRSAPCSIGSALRTKFCASTMVQAPRRKASCSRCCPGSPRCGCGGSLLRRALASRVSAGIAAARGEIVLAIKAGEQHAAEHIPQLLYQLSRSDLVYVRPRLGGWRKFRHRLTRIPRSLVFGLEVRQPERLFWAARREAIAGISLGRGMLRYLPWLVARRGFRVGDMVVEDTASGPPIRDAWPNPWNLFAAWWACRRWSDNATGRIAVHEPSAADADRAADEFLLVDPRAPAALCAGASRSIPRVSSGRRRRTSVTTPPTPCPLLFTRRPHEDIFFGRRAQRRSAWGQFDPQLARPSSRRGVRRLRRTADGRGRLRFARRSDGPGRDVDPPCAVQSAQISGVGQPGRPLFSPSRGRTRSC